MTPNSQTVFEALASVAPGPAVLHEPAFEGNEWEYVKECLDTGWVSSAGKFVDNFEHLLTEFTGSRHAVATVSGTAALHTCLMLAGVEHNDEVIIPAFTFVATANAVAYCGAIPHFVDCERTTLGIDTDKLEQHLAEIGENVDRSLRNKTTGRTIRAIVCMHTFGHPCDLDALARISERYGLILIEDAAESLGSYYKGQHTGTTASLSALSFNGNKIITTGGGGAVLTNDIDLATAAKHLTTTAKLPHKWEFEHDKIGYNYRMPNINAAMGCAQLENMPQFLSQKRILAQRYQDVFQDIEGVNVLTEPTDCRSNYWLNVLLLETDGDDKRDAILSMCHGRGIACRPGWKPMHQLPMYSKCPKSDTSMVEKVYAQAICLPSSAFLGQ
jgi:perosamine synthetase